MNRATVNARRVLSYWRIPVVVLTPIVLLPIPLLWRPAVANGAAISRTLYVIVVMAVYWVTEALPLTVTALLPLLAFPLLKVAPAKEVATHYLTDSSWLFIGSLIVAVAVEETGLHRRIALNILRVTGSAPRWLMIGIMCCTALLSMFISNTATTAMMVPVVLSLVAELIRTERQLGERETDGERMRERPAANRLPPIQVKKLDRIAPVEGNRVREKGVGYRPTTPPNRNVAGGDADHLDSQQPPADVSEHDVKPVIMERRHLSAKELRLAKALLLSASYASSLGGTATLTGTPPNIVMKGLLDDKYGDKHPINYATWIGYNGPGMIINILFAWHWLQLLFFGPRALVSCKRQSAAAVTAIRRVINKEVESLGKWTFAEVSVLCWFAVALVLWLTRELAGWGALFDTVTYRNVTRPDGSFRTVEDRKAFVSDGTCIMVACLALFVWPRRYPCQADDETGEMPVKYRPLLTWTAVQQRLPWGVVFLLGGGFALAKASQRTGLSALIAAQLAEVDLSQFWICVLSLILMTYLTEFTSNTATSQIVLPITMDLAEKRCFNPLYLTMPVSEAASFAYMLPVATPPNAIVFSSGLLTVLDMMIAGFAMNIFCMLEVLLSIHTWGWEMFDIDSFPQWAVVKGDNTTLKCFAANATGL